MIYGPNEVFGRDNIGILLEHLQQVWTVSVYMVRSKGNRQADGTPYANSQLDLANGGRA